MAFLRNIINYGAEANQSARVQSAEANEHARPVDCWSKKFFDFKAAQTKTYSREAVTASGGIVVKANDFANDLVYNRIWVTQNIDFQTIVEDETNYVHIWNAHTFNVNLTAVDDPGDTGVDIAYDTPPVAFNPNEEKSYVVTAYVTGPAQQYSTYEFTIYGTTFSTLIIGDRVLAFPFLPNWRAGVNFAIGFETAIATGRNTYEQRRSLFPSPKRSTSFRVEELDTVAQKVLNYIRFGMGRYIAGNIYHELFWTDGTITGETTITSAVDLSNFYNLNNLSTKLAIIDPVNAKAELKSISSIVGNVVTFENEVVETFDPTTAVFVPIFIALLTNQTVSNLSSSIVSADVQFREVFLNLGDTSTPDIPATTQNLTDLISPNMKQAIRRTVVAARDFKEYYGSAPDLVSLQSRRPETFIFDDIVSSISDINDLTEFFCQHRGRLARFWIDIEIEEFTIASSKGVGATTFDAERNGYENVYSTDDYLYFMWTDGSTQRVRVTDVTTDEVNDEITVTVTPALNYAISSTSVLKIARSFVVRFDIDTLTISLVSKNVARVPFRLYERPNERDEVT